MTRSRRPVRASSSRRCCEIRRSATARLHRVRRSAGLPDRDEVRQHARSRSASPFTARPLRFPSAARTIPRARSWSRRRRRFVRTCSTCSSRRIIRTIFPIPAGRRRHPTTTPATRWPFRWASASIGCSTISTVHSRSVNGLQKPLPGKVTGTGTVGYLLNSRDRTTRSSPSTGCSRPERISRGFAAGPGRRDLRCRQPDDEGTPGQARGGSRAQQFEAVARRPAGDVMKLRKLRIGLADRYGGSMPSGWTRFLLEQFEFPFDVVFPQTLDAGNLIEQVRRADLSERPDSGLDGGRGGRGAGGGGRGGAPDAQNIPAEYRDQLGAITAGRPLPQLKKFLEDGGTIVAVGRSDGARPPAGAADREPSRRAECRRRVRPWPRRSTTCPDRCCRWRSTAAIRSPPGSPITWMCSSTTAPSTTWGRRRASRASGRSRGSTRRHRCEAGGPTGRAISNGGVVAVDAPVGKGRLFLFAPEITFRGQPHGTFKFLFNGIYLAGQSPRPANE